MFSRLRYDIRAIRERDPAARSGVEVFLLYSGLHALIYYRFSHWLYRHHRFFLARMVSQFARFATAVSYTHLSLLSNVVELGVWKTVIEGVIKIAIFVGYLALVSLMSDMKRMFAYHGDVYKRQLTECLRPQNCQTSKIEFTRHWKPRLGKILP